MVPSRGKRKYLDARLFTDGGLETDGWQAEAASSQGDPEAPVDEPELPAVVVARPPPPMGRVEASGRIAHPDEVELVGLEAAEGVAEGVVTPLQLCPLGAVTSSLPPRLCRRFDRGVSLLQRSE